MRSWRPFAAAARRRALQTRSFDNGHDLLSASAFRGVGGQRGRIFVAVITKQRDMVAVPGICHVLGIRDLDPVAVCDLDLVAHLRQVLLWRLHAFIDTEIVQLQAALDQARAAVEHDRQRAAEHAPAPRQDAKSTFNRHAVTALQEVEISYKHSHTWVKAR